MKKKTVALLLALALVFGGAVGGTIAWLTDSTDEVKNTFTTAGIDITLTETWNTDTNSDGETDAWQAQLVPGKEYSKNPVVSVDGTVTDVDIYLFVKFEEKNTPSAYLTYTSTLTAANGWTQGEGTGEGKNGLPANVWYREVETTDSVKAWHLLEGDKVTVKTEFTMPAASATPELVYTAYAIQKDGFETVADAWAEIST